MKRIALVMPCVPYPLRKNGLTVRYFPIIEHLARGHLLDIICIVNNAIERVDVEPLLKYVNEVHIYVREKPKVSLFHKLSKFLFSLAPWTKPFPLVCYDEVDIVQFISDSVKDRGTYDLCISATGIYADQVIKNIPSKKYLLDGVDSLYAQFSSRIGHSPLALYQANTIRRWERKLILRYDYSSYISPHDIKLLKLDTKLLKKVSVIPNGVSFEDFDPEKSEDLRGTFCIGYLGHMGYDSNVRSAIRLANIFRKLKSEIPKAELLIIGRDPSKEIVELGKQEGVKVTGSVESIWPSVNAVDVFVFPMEIGSGQQNKLLEVMHAGKPVVSTTLGNSGVGGVHLQDLLIADEDQDIINQIMNLHDSADLRFTIGSSGKKFVTATYQWRAIFAMIERNFIEGGSVINGVRVV